MTFLDVGAHEGQTLEEVVLPRYGFEHVHAYEPMPRQFAVLAQRFGHLPSVTLHDYGLGTRTGQGALYGDNAAMEASVYSTKRDVDAGVSTVCQFVRASDELAALDGEPGLVVKLNCEGAEVAIVDDLIDGGQLWKVHELMIDFDIRKVPGLEAEAERIVARLDTVGFEGYSLAEEVMRGATHQDRIRHWLEDALG